MPLTAVCSNDLSHEIKVDKWIKKKPYYCTMWGGEIFSKAEITKCPCGAAIVVKEEK